MDIVNTQWQAVETSKVIVGVLILLAQSCFLRLLFLELSPL